MFRLLEYLASLAVFLVLAMLFSPLVLTVRLCRGGRFYLFKDTISAQIQVCGLSLQVGNRIAGWAPPSWFSGRQGRYACGRLILFSPGSSTGRVWAQLLLFGHGFSFVTQRPGLSSYAWPGKGFQLV